MKNDRCLHRTLILIFLIIIFADASSLLAIQLLQRQRPVISDIVTQIPSQKNLRRFETDLEESSWFVRQLRPVVQSMRFSLLNDLGKKAIQGIDGWLFYDLDVRYLTERPMLRSDSTSSEDEALRSILSFHKQLAQRNIHLLLLPAPGKPSIYPEKLTRFASKVSTPLNKHTLRLLCRLETEGIQWIDLFSLYRSEKSQPDTSLCPIYLVQDTHWSPQGMMLAASAVAEKLLALGWTEKGGTDYITNKIPLSRLGDVLRMTRIPGIEARFIPERLEPVQILHAANRQPYMDDPLSDILVLGDSFLRIYQIDEPGSAGFVSHLASQLKKPLASIINDGGASTLVRQELYRKPKLLKGKRVVIWEFVERDIRFGTEGWQEIPLPEDSPDS